MCWPTWCAPTPTSCVRWPGDSALGEGVKLLARAHQSLIWERTRHLLRLRAGLVEYFPGVLGALAAGGLDLGDRDALELLATAPDPDTAAGLPPEQITDGCCRGGRRGDLPARAEAIKAALGAPQLTQRQRRWPAPTPSSPGSAGRRPDQPKAEQVTDAGKPGRCLFWPAPGRGDLP